jgi:hypothetical protein
MDWKDLIIALVSAALAFFGGHAKGRRSTDK